MTKTENITPALKLTYAQFYAVLEAWSNYIFPHVNEMPKDFYALIREYSSEWDVEIPKGTKLFDLAEMLWKSLEAGASEVDRIHDVAFISEQIEFFNDLYSSVERLAPEERFPGLTYSSKELPIEHPSFVFLRLGKPAQLAIVRDGHLDKAVANYEEAERIHQERRFAREQAAEADKEQRRGERAAKKQSNTSTKAK